MLIEIFIVCIIAALRHYRLKCVFYSWTIYPVLLTQVLLVFFQASVFWGTYYFVRFAPFIENAIILSFIFAILVFRLYKPAIIGSLSIVIGTILNKFVIAQNGGKMPVFPSLSYITGYVTPEMFGAADRLHILGSASTKFIFLTDYIDIGYCILSLGDVFVHMFTCIMLYYTIKAANMRYRTIIRN